jgi:hypothetical protein
VKTPWFVLAGVCVRAVVRGRAARRCRLREAAAGRPGKAGTARGSSATGRPVPGQLAYPACGGLPAAGAEGLRLGSRAGAGDGQRKLADRLSWFANLSLFHTAG